ncbi:hypothetical protein WJX82_008914 [Trebouxia sp. C0006]
MDQKAHELLQELTDVFKTREKQLKQAEAALDNRVKHFEDENKQMTTVQVADNDIIDIINIGGTIVSTKRSTLTQAKGSSLAARFSGRWEQCLDRDAQGRVFLDFDPFCFQIVLTYLRARCMDNTLGRMTPSPAVTSEKEHEYQGLIKYLGLEDYMGYSQARFATHHRHILLSPDAPTAGIQPGYDTEGRRDVQGSLQMLAGKTYYYKLRIWTTESDR